MKVKFLAGLVTMAILLTGHVAWAQGEGESGEKKLKFEGNDFIDASGYLRQALACGYIPVEYLEQPYFSQCIESDPRIGAMTQDRPWTHISIEKDQMFDFEKRITLDGPKREAYVLLSIWVKVPEAYKEKPTSLSQLKFGMEYFCDDGAQIWLNGEKISKTKRTGPILPEAVKVDLSKMEPGWNHLLIQFVQASGQWLFSGKFVTADEGFLGELKFALEKPKE